MELSPNDPAEIMSKQTFEDTINMVPVAQLDTELEDDFVPYQKPQPIVMLYEEPACHTSGKLFLWILLIAVVVLLIFSISNYKPRCKKIPNKYKKIRYHRKENDPFMKQMLI